MSADKSKSSDYKKLSKTVRTDEGVTTKEQTSLKPLRNKEKPIDESLVNPLNKPKPAEEKSSELTVPEIKISNGAAKNKDAEKVLRKTKKRKIYHFPTIKKIVKNPNAPKKISRCSAATIG